jgi:hypothetical protein
LRRIRSGDGVAYLAKGIGNTLHTVRLMSRLALPEIRAAARWHCGTLAGAGDSRTPCTTRRLSSEALPGAPAKRWSQTRCPSWGPGVGPGRHCRASFGSDAPLAMLRITVPAPANRVRYRHAEAKAPRWGTLGTWTSLYPRDGRQALTLLSTQRRGFAVPLWPHRARRQPPRRAQTHCPPRSG